MKKINYISDDTIYYEKLDNGLKVFMYPTNKSKNFYCTVSTHFGSMVMKYKKDNRIYDVTKGSAHFLEHRVMDFSKNEEAMRKLSEYGSLVNAYTTYNGTNFNIFGHEKILDNLEMLFDRVFKAKIKEIDVENERGIILEEYYMVNSDPFYLLETKNFANAFNKSFIRYPVIGTVEGIKKVKCEELNRLYNDFYTFDNMFVVVCGNFNKKEVLNYIKEYTSNIKRINNKLKVLKSNEKENVNIVYEEMSLPVEEAKVSVCYKTKIPKKIDKLKYKLIINSIVGEYFNKTGEGYLDLLNNKIERYSFNIEEIDNYLIINFKASTDKYNDFLNIVDKYVNNMKITNELLERKKKAFLRSFILSFEDIVGVEDMITSDIFAYNKLLNNIDKVFYDINLKEANSYLKDLDLKNKTTLVIKPV